MFEADVTKKSLARTDLNVTSLLPGLACQPPLVCMSRNSRCEPSTVRPLPATSTRAPGSGEEHDVVGRRLGGIDSDVLVAVHTTCEEHGRAGGSEPVRPIEAGTRGKPGARARCGAVRRDEQIARTRLGGRRAGCERDQCDCQQGDPDRRDLDHARRPRASRTLMGRFRSDCCRRMYARASASARCASRRTAAPM